MKYLSKIIAIAGVVLGMTACSESSEFFVLEERQPGDMTVNICFDMPQRSAVTRSKVSGIEEPVSVMQMICFDANGLYLGIRDAEVTPQGPGSNPTMYDTGIIKGSVPQGTARIHFIANRSLTIPLSFNVGTAEETVMKSMETSTKWDDTDHQKICYWGYHKEASADDMNNWLNPKEGDPKSIVYMIRDRAKVVLNYDPTGAKVPVTKIEWLIHNGNERGYLAPKSSEWESYYSNSTAEGYTSDLISVATLNEYTGGMRYSLWTSDDENDEENFDVAYQSTGSYESKPQFLFDDDNTAIDDVKVILRVTYTVDDAPKEVYHVLRLNDNAGNLYDVIRNNTYYINAKLLSPDIAFYETLKDAIEGTEFVNADVEVDRSIPDINDDQYTLQIKLPTETTSIVLNTEGEHQLDFVFRLISDINTSGSTNRNDFQVYWEKKPDFCSEALPVSYVETTKQFQITVNVIADKLSDKLQDEWIVVKHKTTGLTRYIHVYVIDQFRYKIYPTLTKSKDAEDGNPAEYVLHFQIPPMEHKEFIEDEGGNLIPNPNELIYPASLYPIDVKFTTNTLNAYGIQDGSENFGLFGVSVESTQQLTQVNNFEAGYNNPVSTINTMFKDQWYFQQAEKYWDFWYTYSLKTCPPDLNGDGNPGDVYIYFKDVRNHIQYAEVENVGLFLYIEYFGKNYSVPVTTVTP